ncbi:MAG TPA: VWA domain-containing protein, partial [Geminicoccaceae bacterium]
NRRRHDDTLPLLDVIRTYPSDYSVVFVGDASMSPYEIAMPGGSVEHWNAEAGQVWLGRVLAHFPKAVWLNPLPREHWDYTQSIGMVRRLFGDRMFPLNVEGIDGAMRALMR